MVMSSAYDTICMLPGGNGSLDMYRLKSVGDRTPPCGTPCLTFLRLDFLSRTSTYVCRPWRYEAIHLLVLFERFELTIVKKELVVHCVKRCSEI